MSTLDRFIQGQPDSSDKEIADVAVSALVLGASVLPSRVRPWIILIAGGVLALRIRGLISPGKDPVSGWDPPVIPRGLPTWGGSQVPVPRPTLSPNMAQFISYAS